ncbi:hypothetical protein JYU34_020129 [Plutella xylostella]|uniref:Uncharacterized protein n=1 Tax=Plutella xylostella TaxID=51655 RepID=A0ABQ7PVZ4_PLUXY|nr:hypothetical protein JYU34_020129 [Plutella xylostella]
MNSARKAFLTTSRRTPRFDSEFCSAQASKLTSADRKEGTQKGRTSAFPFFRTWLRDSDRKEGTPTKANPRFPESPRRSPSQGADFARAGASTRWSRRQPARRRHARRHGATRDVTPTPRTTSQRHHVRRPYNTSDVPKREVASATPDTRLAQQRRPSLPPRRPSPPPRHPVACCGSSR